MYEVLLGVWEVSHHFLQRALVEAGDASLDRLGFACFGLLLLPLSAIGLIT